MELVLPLLLGPKTSVERSAPLDTSPNSLRQKYIPRLNSMTYNCRNKVLNA